MNEQLIEGLITNLGFPIVVCIALFWLVVKTNENYNNMVEKLRQTIQENTKLIEDVLDHLKEEEK